ncbi:MAG: DUF2782 domain-containing protein [Candidatus Polarisedimenticolaceae bacterium]|nr:DUF2782 domain-containing protein [Candidatus Polarisedimenticolaceae bacterium]
MKYLLPVAGLLLALPVLADQAADELIEPPMIPQQVESGEVLEPDVIIRKGEEETHYEYRVNGQLYMVKVVPNFGPVYYLVDTDGDGSLESREQAIDEMSVPRWVLFSW